MKESLVSGFFILFLYALGYGSVLASAMLGVGLGINRISVLLTKVAKVIKYVSGTILIVLGFYFLLSI